MTAAQADMALLARQPWNDAAAAALARVVWPEVGDGELPPGMVPKSAGLFGTTPPDERPTVEAATATVVLEVLRRYRPVFDVDRDPELRRKFADLQETGAATMAEAFTSWGGSGGMAKMIHDGWRGCPEPRPTHPLTAIVTAWLLRQAAGESRER